MDIEDQFFSKGAFSVQNKKQTRFWEDVLLDNKKLKVSYYSCLYNRVRNKWYSGECDSHISLFTSALWKNTKGEML
jgi:hypothetical protein